MNLRIKPIKPAESTQQVHNKKEPIARKTIFGNREWMKKQDLTGCQKWMLIEIDAFVLDAQKNVERNDQYEHPLDQKKYDWLCDFLNKKDDKEQYINHAKIAPCELSFTEIENGDKQESLTLSYTYDSLEEPETLTFYCPFIESKLPDLTYFQLLEKQKITGKRLTMNDARLAVASYLQQQDLRIDGLKHHGNTIEFCFDWKNGWRVESVFFCRKPK